MTPEENVPVEQITPAVAEQKVSAAVEDVVDDNTVIEEDGDFFWVIQRIAWGIIKTLFILALVGALVWLVWGSSIPFFNNNTSETVVSVVEPAPIPVPEVVTPTIPTGATVPDNNLYIEDLAYALADQNSPQGSSTISQTTDWLKQVQIIGNISAEVLRLNNPNTRAQKIEETIRASEALLNESPQIQRNLSEEFNFYFQKGDTANQSIADIDAQLQQALKNFDGPQLESLIATKVSQQQTASANLTEAKVRQTLLKNVQNFDRLLRQKSIPLLSPTEIRANSR